MFVGPLSLCLAFAAGCSGSGPIASDGEETESKVIGGTPTSDLPAVVAVLGDGNCTGTFIGKRTMILAAHCIDDADSTGGTTYTSPSGASFRSIKSFHHGIWGDDVVKHVVASDQRDVAILVFGEDVAPAVMHLGFDLGAPSTSATIIGFGYTSATSPVGRGQKNKASVTIARRVAGQAYVLEGLPSIGHGDSGSPLLVGGKIIGIASASNDRLDASRFAIYADLSLPENRELLKRAVAGGADIATEIPAKEPGATGFDIAGKKYAGEFFCSDPVELSACPISIDFQAGGVLAIDIPSQKSLWQGRYLQKADKVLAGNEGTFNPDDPTTQFTYGIHAHGSSLYDDDGRMTTLTK